jgi:hypothetical protein
MAKEVSKLAYQFFNNSLPPETPVLLFGGVLAKMNEFLLPLGLDAGALWVTNLSKYDNLVKVVAMGEPLNSHFCRFWMDQVVDGFGHQLFNTVFATRFLNRDDPNKSDRDADALATKVTNQYYDYFR